MKNAIKNDGSLNAHITVALWAADDDIRKAADALIPADTDDTEAWEARERKVDELFEASDSEIAVRFGVTAEEVRGSPTRTAPSESRT